MAQVDTFTRIDFPGSVETDAHGINARGDIVGGYALPGEKGGCSLIQGACPHSFMLNKDGEFSSYDVDGATFTFFTHNNARGDIIGWYGTPDGRVHGFLLSGNDFTSIDYPGSITTFSTGLNDHGDVVGRYESPDHVQHGFLLTDGEFTTIDLPGINNASGINDRGDIVGGRTRGYLLTGWPSSPELAFIDFPGAILTNCNTINNSGSIVGRADSPDGVAHGYLLRNGEFTIIDYPGAVGFTSVIAINSRGDMVGKFKTADGKLHGYLLSR